MFHKNTTRKSCLAKKNTRRKKVRRENSKERCAHLTEHRTIFPILFILNVKLTMRERGENGEFDYGRRFLFDRIRMYTLK